MACCLATQSRLSRGGARCVEAWRDGVDAADVAEAREAAEAEAVKRVQAAALAEGAKAPAAVVPPSVAAD